MRLPLIGVVPFIKVHALYKIATLTPEGGDPFGTSKKGKDVVYPMMFAPLDEVFADTAPDEAMFVCYRHADGIPIPRLTKAVEGKIPLACDVVAFDVDNHQQFGVKGKLAWSSLGEERTEIMQERILAALQILAAADASPVCFYRSKNGLRFVHVLHTSITPAGLELAFKRLAKIYAQAEILVDTACFDWTRCFKVPRCTLADGTVTGDASWFRIEWFPDAVTLAEPDEIAAQPQVGHAGEVLVGECMEASHARELVQRDGKLTEDGRAASSVISGDPLLHSICFGNQPIIDHRGDGKTHNTLTKLVGRLTKRCVGHPWCTEQFLFGLVALKIMELGDDEPWLDKAWGMICDYLAGDRAELEERNASVEAEVAEKTTPPPKGELQVFTDGIKKWFPDAIGQEDEEVVRLVKEARLGIVTNQEHGQTYVLSKNGFYTNQSVGPDKVSVVLREQEMEWLVPTVVEQFTEKTGKSKVFARSWPHYLAEDVRTFATTKMLCVHRGNYLGQDENGNTQLIISPFWLRDLDPKFNEEIETWLQLAAPDGEAENLIKALAYTLAFQHGPTASVALIGPARVGKKLIVTGLAECINTQQACPGRVLVARFNDGLVDSPIVWIDEGLPKGKDGIDFADTFRNLVTGGKLYVEPKGKGIFEVAGVHRIVLTANNESVVAALGSGGARTQDDLDAISERLVVFHLQQRAADWLKSRNTKGWIAGDNGSPSKNVIARHLLYHYYNTLDWVDGAPVKLGNRLLYEGNRDGSVQQTIDEANEQLPEIAATINEMVRAGQAAVKEGKVFVLWQPLQHRCCSSGRQMKVPEFRSAARSLFLDSHNTTINGVAGRYQVAKADRIVALCSRVATVAPQFNEGQA